MKTNNTVKRLLLLGAVTFSIGISAQAANGNCENMQANIPKNLVELALKTRLNVDLNNDCTFQPIHYQVRTEQPTTEIIARFTGKKMGDDFAIEKIELKHFEVNENPRTVIIDNAYFETKDNMKIIVVELRNLDDAKWADAAERKQRLEKEIVDYVLIPDNPEMVNRDMIIDTHIINEKILYPEPEVLKLGDEKVLGRPAGRHCNNTIIY